MRMSKFPMVVSGALALVVAGGCKKEEPSPHTETSAAGSGREVAVLSDCPVTARHQDGYLSVALPGHLVVIQKDHLQLDSEDHGRFPAAATRFILIYTNNSLHISANGIEVLKTNVVAKPGARPPAKK